ncbi:hypothetical protein FJZ48_01090 [Candidatus Uhrbacteria bacterium]|nr:hypothetical protein [Candidatus Uhrbacteria bacterium]
MSDEFKSKKWASGVVTSLFVGVLLAGVVSTLNKDRGLSTNSATSSHQIIIPSSDQYVSPLGKIVQALPLDPTWFGFPESSNTSSLDTREVTKKHVSSTLTLIKDAEGKTYTDPKVLGVIDPTHVAVVANSDTGKAVLSVNQEGRATPLAMLSSSTTPFLNNQGSVCLK